MAHHGKKYRDAVKKLEGVTACGLDEAVKLLKTTSTTKFDSSLEIHMRLNVDPTHADQMVRATLALPNGTGKEVRVIAFVADDRAKEAKAAGAMKVGMDDLIDEISKGFIDFDVAVATPDAMKSLGKIAKILGTKGLMPNPKAGTVTTDIGKTIEAIKKGRVEFRTDKMGQIHNIFGKVSFSEEQIKENLKSFIRAVIDTKPASIKGTFIANIGVATSMGPGIKLDMQKVLQEIK